MENQNTQLPAPAMRDDDEINLLDLLLVLAQNKGMIFITTFASAFLAVAYALTLDNIYTGTTKILPPQQSQSASSAMLGQLGGLAGLAGGSLGLKNPNDLYIAMLGSRKVLGKIANKFELQKIYGTKTLTNTLNALRGRAKFTSGKDGMITVEVDDLDPKRAADMANAFIEELSAMLQTNAVTDASLKRAFFEQQLRQAKDKLTDAELVLDRTPNTDLGYLDAVRNLKYQEAIWETLAKQFEMSKMDEAKDFPQIQVLDKATPPEDKSKPQRSQMVILATLVAFFLAVIMAFIKEALIRSRCNPEQNARLQELRRTFRWRT